jgi:hypothetical protein
MKGDVSMSSPYLAYLLRLWRVETEDGPVWRAVLEDPHGVERRGFADLPALYRFLDQKTDAAWELTESADTLTEEGRESQN